MRKTFFLLLVLAVSLGLHAKVIRVLAIGNSFSEDAVEQNLHELSQADGNQIVVANMYIGGCPLKRHWNNAENDLPAYRYRKVGLDGVRHQTDGMSISRALQDEKWDYISLQQASGSSGIYDTYQPYLTELMSYLRKRCPRARYIWHETWAYAKDSNHGEFPKYHNDQMEMFNAIVGASRRAMADAKLKIVVPSGTAVQNARTSFIGDNMNRDGYHLNLVYGRYTAACAWYETLSGHSVVGNGYAPAGLHPDIARVAQEAAHAAVQNPWTVTDLSGIMPSEKLYKNATVPTMIRVEDLLSRMTLDEKVMQMNQYTLGRNNIKENQGEAVRKIPAETGALIYFNLSPELRNAVQRHAMEDSRLGIPIIFGYDVIHGFRTIFPIPLAQACTFNPRLVRQGCRVAAQEARMSGVDWTFSPMIDVAHDPRWGRVAEGYGEDPYLSGVMACAAVEGYQGKSLADSLSVAACLKHYVAYGASEAGRDYVFTEVSDQTLWDTYLPPYRAAMRTNPATVMSSFNNLSGVPVTASRKILTDILRGRLGFRGFVVSDWGAISQLRNQGSAKTSLDAAVQSVNAGLDMDMMSRSYDANLAKAVAGGLVDTATIDQSVRRILKVKFDLGLFEHPYTAEPKDESRFLRPASLEAEEQAAEESMVLLKNKDSLLPLEGMKSIAVIGPMISTRIDLAGCWRGHADVNDFTTILNGMKAEFGDGATINSAQGCAFDSISAESLHEAVGVARKSDVVVLCLGEKCDWSGENRSKSSIELPQAQQQLLEALSKTGKKIVLVIANGRPLQLNRMEPLADAIVEMWQPGVAGGTPLARILSGKVNPSGKLAMTFPYVGGQIPIYYNRRQRARRGSQGLYIDGTSEPLYSFGDGLSYTSFKYSVPRVSKQVLDRNDDFTVDVQVSNTGSRDGKEAVLGFVSCKFARLTRPVRELRFFDKKDIAAGKSVNFHFKLNAMRDLGFVNDKGDSVLEPGEYEIEIGGNKVTVEVK